MDNMGKSHDEISDACHINRSFIDAVVKIYSKFQNKKLVNNRDESTANENVKCRESDIISEAFKSQEDDCNMEDCGSKLINILVDENLTVFQQIY